MDMNYGVRFFQPTSVLTVDIFKTNQILYQLLFNLLFCHELLTLLEG